MNNWKNEFIKELSQKSDVYYLTVVRTPNSTAPILYEVIDNEVQHSNELDCDLSEKYMDYFWDLQKPGIYILKYENAVLAEEKYISHYNVELFDADVCELLLFQEYGMEPVGDERKETLKASIKAEKIKETLVYACYLNDTEKILERLEKVSKAQLNKMLAYYGTPLGLCAENDNLEAFKAIAKKGADLNKVSLGERPLALAFINSPEIVLYIYENYREQFDKEVGKKRFGLAYQTRDLRVLELLKNYGCDMECAGANFPPLHNFADYNNLVGIQFFADNGANLNVLNVHKQTALDRAKNRNNTEAIELLEKLMR